GCAAGASDHRRRQSDPAPSVRLHALHHDRLGSAVPSERNLRLAVPADGRGGHVRDGLPIYPYIHARAHDGEVYVEGYPHSAHTYGRRTARSEPVEESFSPLPAGVRTALRAVP